MDGSEIYVKTPKGVAEVGARSATLSMAARRVLIMMDGKRTVDELAVLVRPGEIEAIVTQLVSEALAEKPGLDGSATAPEMPGADAPPEPAAPPTAMDERELAPMTLEEAKRRAVRELNERLGPEADV